MKLSSTTLNTEAVLPRGVTPTAVTRALVGASSDGAEVVTQVRAGLAALWVQVKAAWDQADGHPPAGLLEIGRRGKLMAQLLPEPPRTGAGVAAGSVDRSTADPIFTLLGDRAAFEAERQELTEIYRRGEVPFEPLSTYLTTRVTLMKHCVRFAPAVKNPPGVMGISTPRQKPTPPSHVATPSGRALYAEAAPPASGPSLVDLLGSEHLEDCVARRARGQGTPLRGQLRELVQAAIYKRQDGGPSQAPQAPEQQRKMESARDAFKGHFHGRPDCSGERQGDYWVVHGAKPPNEARVTVGGKNAFVKHKAYVWFAPSSSDPKALASEVERFYGAIAATNERLLAQMTSRGDGFSMKIPYEPNDLFRTSESTVLYASSPEAGRQALQVAHEELKKAGLHYMTSMRGRLPLGFNLRLPDNEQVSCRAAIATVVGRRLYEDLTGPRTLARQTHTGLAETIFRWADEAAKLPPAQLLAALE